MFTVKFWYLLVWYKIWNEHLIGHSQLILAFEIYISVINNKIYFYVFLEQKVWENLGLKMSEFHNILWENLGYYFTLCGPSNINWTLISLASPPQLVPSIAHLITPFISRTTYDWVYSYWIIKLSSIFPMDKPSTVESNAF